jgi:hypothetical protein
MKHLMQQLTGREAGLLRMPSLYSCVSNLFNQCWIWKCKEISNQPAFSKQPGSAKLALLIPKFGLD